MLIPFALALLALPGFSQTPQSLGQLLKNNGGKLPTPFEKLMQAAGGDQSNVILVPRGRSLVADKTDYKAPRILFNPSSTTDENPARLIIGYTPGTDSMEIMTWNPDKKEYDFVEVNNYSKPQQQKLSRSHEGKCTTCHTDTRLLFPPAPWGETLDSRPAKAANLETRPRDVPVKIADALKGAPGYPNYFGIDLEKYKTASSKNVSNFFNSISRSEQGRRNREVCDLMCQSGNADDDRACRKQILKASLRTLLGDDPSKSTSAVAPKKPKQDPQVNALIEKEGTRLSGSPVRANNFLIPERDPETNEFFRPPETEAEQIQVAKQVEKAQKSGVPDTHANLIKMTPAEVKKFRIGQNLKTKGAVEDFEVAAALQRGCLQLNQTEIEALRSLDLEKLLTDIDKNHGLVDKWPQENQNLIKALGKTQGKSLMNRNSEELACKEALETALGHESSESVKGNTNIVDKYYLGLPKSEQYNTFDAYCMKCHEENGNPLPYKDVISGKIKGNEEKQQLMIEYLTDCYMPQGEPKPSLELRKKMIEAVGGKVAPNFACPKDS